MKNYRKHIDDFFREKLGNYTETPPPDVWEDLTQRLDGLQPATGFTPRMLLHVAMASLLLVVGVSLVRTAHNNSYTNNLAANNKAVAGTVNNTTPANNTTNEKPVGSTEKTASVNNEQNTPANTEGTKSSSPGNDDQQMGNTPAGANNKGANSNNTLPNKQKNKHAAARVSNGTRYAASGSQNDNAVQATAKGSNPNEGIKDISEEKQMPDAANAAILNNSLIQNQPVTLKKENPVTSKAKIAGNEKVNTPKPDFTRFELGVKAGYEGGFNSGAASKYVVSPYLQYNITRKWSVMTQPAIKSATINGTNIGNPQASYQITGTGQPSLNRDSLVISSNGIRQDTTHYTNYTYTQTHDSVVKSYTYGGTYMEFEIPILLKYNICNKFSVYGGVSINYAKLISINEHTYESNNILVSANATSVSNAGIAPPLPTSDVIKYPGYASESNPASYVSPQGSILRCGYMIGFSYEYSKRWLFDGLVQQSPVKPDVQGSYNLNTPFSSTYFRLSVGYKIIK